MILRRLHLTAEINCEFHDGMNIILGTKVPKNEQVEATDDADTNGVGKTTIVNCIRYALGAGVSEFSNLDYFKEKKFWVRLEALLEGTSVVFCRPLWKPLGDDVCLIFYGTLDAFHATLNQATIDLNGIVSADEARDVLGKIASIRVLTSEEFKTELSRLEHIDYSKAKITFQSLLEYLVRDEKTGYTDIISMPSRTQWVQYRAVQYLFGLPFTLEQEIGNFTDYISKKRAEFEMMNSELVRRKITSSDTIVNRRIVYTKHLKTVREQLSKVMVSPNLASVRDEYNKTRTELLETNRSINNLEHKSRSYKETLGALNEKGQALEALLNIESFYNDLVEIFPGQVKTNLEQYKSFFESVSIDRTSYYEDLISSLDKDLRLLRTKRKATSERLDILGNRFESTSIVRDVASLASEEEGIKRDLQDLELMETYLNRSESLSDEIEEEKKKRDALVKTGRDLEKNSRKQREKIITIFKDWVELVYGTDEGSLEFKFNSNPKSETLGRTEIDCYIPSRNSFGRGIAMIVLFDLVWFLRERIDGEFDPGFLVHDGPYVVISDEAKPKILDLILSLLADTKKQYILTANDGDLPELEKYRKYVCKELDGSSDDGKFLRERYNDRMA